MCIRQKDYNMNENYVYDGLTRVCLSLKKRPLFREQSFITFKEESDIYVG